MLYLYFGSRLTKNAIKDVNSFAINWDISIDAARILYLQKIVELLSESKTKPNYWDRLFGRFLGKDVLAPALWVEECIEPGGLRIPQVVIDKAFAIEQKTNLEIPIDNSTLDFVGREIEEEFGVEFIEFSRKKLLRSRTATIF